MKPFFQTKQLICIVVCSVFSAQSGVLAYAAETNFWKKRQLNRLAEPVQLASLPMPTITPSMPYGLSKAYGSLRSSTQPANEKDGPTVIHIQDVHMNKEAQHNIYKTVQSLIENKKVDLILLEGAFSHFDLESFQQFEPKESVKAVADYFYEKKKISGPVYAAYTARDRAPPVIGIDDQNYYQANVKAYQTSVPLISSAKEEWKKEKSRLLQQKAQVLNKEVYAFDQTVVAYRDKKIGLGEYLQKISGRSKMINLFLEAFKLEKDFDFKQVERERSRFLEALFSRIDKIEKARIVNLSLAYRSGVLSHVGFYRSLKDEGEKQQIDFSKYPSLNRYVHYLELAEKLDARTLLSEMRDQEKSIYRRLIKTQKEEQIIQKSYQNYLKGKLINFSLTPEEWNEYRTVGAGLRARPNAQGSTRLGGHGGPPLRSFEDFYIQAERRDKAISKNLIQAIEKNKAKTAVLVTGGFHAPGIQRRIEKAGLNVVSFVPKLTKVETEKGSSYLTVFSQEKTPLDQIFEGRKLFLPTLMQPNRQLMAVETAKHAHQLGVNFSDAMKKLGFPIPRHYSPKARSGSSSIQFEQGSLKTKYGPGLKIIAITFVLLGSFSIGAYVLSNFFFSNPLMMVSGFEFFSQSSLASLSGNNQLVNVASINLFAAGATKNLYLAIFGTFVAIASLFFFLFLQKILSPQKKKAKFMSLEQNVYDPEFIKNQRKISAGKTTVVIDLDETLGFASEEIGVFGGKSRKWYIREGIEAELDKLIQADIRLVLWSAGNRRHVEKFFDENQQFVDKFDFIIVNENYKEREKLNADQLEEIYTGYTSVNPNITREAILEYYKQQDYDDFPKDASLLGYKFLFDDNVWAVDWGKSPLGEFPVITDLAYTPRNFKLLDKETNKIADQIFKKLGISSSKPQSWLGTWGGRFVYGGVMPLIEEAFRLGLGLMAGLDGWLSFMLITSLIHAALHVFVDVKEGGWKLFFKRLPGRFVLSSLFSLAYWFGPNLFFYEPGLHHQFFFGFGAHAFNNLFLSEYLTPAMSVAFVGKKIKSLKMTSGEEEEEEKIDLTETLLNYEADYGFLPQKHQTMQFLESRLDALLPGLDVDGWPRLRVLASTGYGINAEAYEDGTVIISPEILSLADDMEEVDALLLHEINHWARKHHKTIRSLERGRKLLDLIGYRRFIEYEADMATFFQMAEKHRKTNPRGLISLLEKLRALEREEKVFSYWSLEYGDISHRILNLKRMSFLLTLLNFDRPLTQIEVAIKKNIPKKEGKKVYRLVKEIPWQPQKFDKWIEDVGVLIGRADMPFLHAVMKSLFEKIQQQQKKTAELEDQGTVLPNSFFNKQKTQIFLFRKAFEKWNSLFEDQYNHLPESQKDLVRAILLEGSAHVPVITDRMSSSVKKLKLDKEYARYRDRLDTKGALKVFSIALAHTGIQVNQSRIFQLATKTLRIMLEENGLFDDEESEFDVKSYINQSAGFLIGIDRALIRYGYKSSEDNTWGLTRAWNENTLNLIAVLSDFGQWDGWRKKFIRIVNQAGKKEPLNRLKLDVSYVEERVQNLKSIPPPKRQESQSKRMANFIKLKKSFKKINYSKIYKELNHIREALLKIEKGRIDYKNKEHKELLVKAAQLFNQLPAEVPTPRAFEWKDETSDVSWKVKKTLQRYELISGFSFGLFFSVDPKDGLFPKTNDAALTIIHWFQLVAANEMEYELFLRKPESWFLADLPFVADLKEFNRITEAIENPKNAKKLFELNPIIKSTELKVNDIGMWSTLSLGVLAKEISGMGEPDVNKFFKAIDSYLKKWPVPDHIQFGHRNNKILSSKRKIFNKGISFLNLTKGKVTKKEARSLLLLSYFLTDQALKRQLQEYLVIKILGWEKEGKAGVNIIEAINLTLRGYVAQEPLINAKILDQMDERAKSKQDIETLENGFLEYLENRHGSMGGFGHLVLGDAMVAILMSPKGRLPFFKALLSSGQNDQELRDVLVDQWWNIYNKRIIEAFRDKKSDNPDIFLDDEFDLDEYRKKGDLIPFQAADDLLQSIYRLGPVERVGLLRLLMVGKEGLLSEPESRRQLLDSFLREYVKPEDEKDERTLSVLKKIFGGILSTAPEDELYLILSSIIQDRIGQVPDTQGSYKEKAAIFAKEILDAIDSSDRNRETILVDRDIRELDSILSRLPRDKITIDKFKSALDRLNHIGSDELNEFLDNLKKDFQGTHGEYHLSTIREALAKIYNLNVIFFIDFETSFSPVIGEDDRYEYNALPMLNYDSFNEVKSKILKKKYEKNVEIYRKKLLKLMQPVDLAGQFQQQVVETVMENFEPRKADVFTPLGLIIKSANQLGTPGKRLLQLMGKTIKLPPEIKKGFDAAVYDDIKGQSIVAANRLIKQEMPEYWEKIVRYERVGGGSLFTVYEVLLDDGTEEILRVMNPQAEYHAKVHLDIMENALEYLIENAATEEEARQFSQGRPLIHLLRDWISNELADQTFYEDDKRFYARWNGQDLDGAGKKVVISKSYETGSKYIRREQVIRGKNFTALSDSPPLVQKKMVALALQHYIQQVLDSETNLIHSDISPGNLRITEEEHLAILDRGMYLKLTNEERGLIIALSMSSDARSRAEMFVEWIWGLEENQEVIKALNKESVIQTVYDFTKDNQAQSGLDTLRIIHDFNLSVSLNVTLMFKNINVFDKLAEEVGLGNLSGALVYDWTQEKEPGMSSLGGVWIAGVVLTLLGSSLGHGFGFNFGMDILAWVALNMVAIQATLHVFFFSFDVNVLATTIRSWLPLTRSREIDPLLEMTKDLLAGTAKPVQVETILNVKKAYLKEAIHNTLSKKEEPLASSNFELHRKRDRLELKGA